MTAACRYWQSGEIAARHNQNDRFYCKPEKLISRLKDKGYPFRERQVPSMDLFQVFVEDPNGITVELNYWTEDQKAA